MTTTDTSSRLAERYGSSRRLGPRWLLPVAFTGVVLAGLVVAVTGYLSFGSAPIEAGVTRWTIVSDTEVFVRLEVRRDDESRPGICLVRAKAQDLGEVGRIEVNIPPDTTYVDATLSTTSRAVIAEVYGCKYA